MFNRVSCISAHCDDIEFACGGTVAKLIEQGSEVYVLNYSFCIKSLPDGISGETIIEEFYRFMNNLGVVKSNIVTSNLIVREFPSYRQDILDTMIEQKKKINPDLVLIPNSKDIHQDHNTIYQEGVRGFKGITTLGYEMPWNCLEFKSNCRFKLEKKHVETKYNSIDIYESQKFRGMSDRELIFANARVRGIQAGSKYAEAFEVIRWVNE